MSGKQSKHPTIAVVTGAARGIGRGIAEALAGQRSTVIIIDKDSAQSVVDAIIAGGGIAEAYQADVTKAASVRQCVRKILRRHNRIDILVNNVGTSQRKNILEITEQDWDRLMNINLKSAFFCSKAILPTMIKHRAGRIINLSSIAARRGSALGHVHYSATKAGLIGMTRTLAAWAAQYGITVNAVAPGCIDTELLRQIHPLKEIQAFAKITPLQRVGTTAEVGELVAFLAGKNAGFITGAVIDINGGAWIGS
ncbi:MAG TPA: SDR family NAD(P)-dependent oxidoreductase [Tepidisphaeraceae bacterium]|nr:SDR family NAD(P)-dependent oxidoreductase [Tepidisphaeraceae bacterium]